MPSFRGVLACPTGRRHRDRPQHTAGIIYPIWPGNTLDSHRRTHLGRRIYGLLCWMDWWMMRVTGCGSLCNFISSVTNSVINSALITYRLSSLTEYRWFLTVSSTAFNLKDVHWKVWFPKGYIIAHPSYMGKSFTAVPYDVKVELTHELQITFMSSTVSTYSLSLVSCIVDYTLHHFFMKIGF